MLGQGLSQVQHLFQSKQKVFPTLGTIQVITSGSNRQQISFLFYHVSDSPVDMWRGHTQPSGRGPGPGCRHRTHSLCCSTCHHGSAPCPHTGSFPWRQRIRHNNNQHASLWSDPARKRHGEVKSVWLCLAFMYSTIQMVAVKESCLSCGVRQRRSQVAQFFGVCVCCCRER